MTFPEARTTPRARTGDPTGDAQLRRVLGLPSLILFGLVYMGRTLVIGAVWLSVGVLYLGILTRGFRRPPPTLTLAH